MKARAVRRPLIASLGALLAVTSLGSAPSFAADPTPAPEAASSPTADASADPNPQLSPAPDQSPEPSPQPSPSAAPSASPDPSATPSASTSPSPSASASPTLGDDEGDIDDYIVVVRNGAYIDSVKDKAEKLGGQSDKELRGGVDGFTAELTEEDAQKLAEDPNVRYVEPDSLIELNSATFRTVTKTTTSNLSSCDDCSSPSMSLGFTLDWFGTQYTNIYINTNGGAVLDDGRGTFNSYRNFDLRTATRPYILPLFTDLNPAANGTVEFGRGTISDGSTKNVFWAEWVDVAEYGKTRLVRNSRC